MYHAEIQPPAKLALGITSAVVGLLGGPGAAAQEQRDAHRALLLVDAITAGRAHCVDQPTGPQCSIDTPHQSDQADARGIAHYQNIAVKSTEAGICFAVGGLIFFVGGVALARSERLQDND